MTVSLQDSVWALGNTNAGDLCIRCHTPTGWLGGRSDPPTTEALAGSDFEGVSCDYCHTAIDPFAALGQPELGAETEAPAEAEVTQSRDLDVLSTIRMFDGTTPFSAGDGLPTYYGTGDEEGKLPNYIEATSGQYFVDPGGAKRGPRSDPKARHQWNYSRFHKTKYMCATCHDVSNPVLASVLIQGIPGILNRMPLPASCMSSGPVYDSYNYNILAGITYAGAKVDVSGIQGYGQALLDGAERARQQLGMAATLEDHSIEGAGDIKLRIVNNTGHKLLSGFPEGRRLWLNVKFYDSAGVETEGSEINPYDETTGVLTVTHDDLVYEAKMSSKDLIGESAAQTFHFVLATERYKDNRIPPKGFGIDANGDFAEDAVAARLALPRWGGEPAPTYFTVAEYAGGYDEVTIPKPGTADSWEAELYYQTTSKEYIEFLKDEINGDVKTLEEPGPSGEDAYIAQTDPYFASIRDWGDAIYDLWLKNDKCPPIEIASREGGGDPPDPPEPPPGEACVAPGTPTGLSAEAGRRDIKLTWDGSAEAHSYNVYYFQNEKYTYLDSTSNDSYTHSGLDQGQTFTYAVTAYVTCEDGSVLESGYSDEASATVPFKGKGGKK